MSSRKKENSKKVILLDPTTDSGMERNTELATQKGLLQKKFKHRGMTDFFTQNGEKIEYTDMFWFVDLFWRLKKYSSPPHESGIYMWFNVTKQTGYIGSTKDLHRRCSQFLHLKTKYGNGNIMLSNDRMEHPEDFVFLILERVEDTRILKAREQFYIDKYNTLTEGYNIKSSRCDIRPIKNLQSVDGKKERTVIHLHILKSDEHIYFGSMTNIFDYYTPETIGITYKSLRNYRLSANKPFKSDFCVIRKGILRSKRMQNNRKRHNAIDD